MLLRSILFSSCLLLPTIANTCVQDNEEIAKAQTAVKALGKSLKTELQAAMKAGGPLAAIDVCHTKAQPLTAEVSKAQNLSIKRTSLKLRNPANKPDKWELDTLEFFEEQIKAGTPAAELETHNVVIQGEKVVLRYMKAIPTGGVCLACHGEKLSPKVAKAINERYPDDKATGFNVGDMRGAFSVTVPIAE